MEVGAIFDSKQEAAVAVLKENFCRGKSVKRQISDSRRVHFTCTKERCPFNTHFRKTLEGKWHATAYVDHSNCAHTRKEVISCIRTDDLSILMLPHILREPGVTTSDLGRSIRPELGIDLPRYKLARGRQAAMDMAFGTVDSSYKKLEPYGQQYVSLNHGSVFEVQSTNGVFQQLFLLWYKQSKLDETFTPVIESRLETRQREAGSMHVTTFTDSNHRVLDDSNTYNVDLSAKKCSCLCFRRGYCLVVTL